MAEITAAEAVKLAVDAVFAECAESRERSLVLTKLDEARLWLGETPRK
jgi:hypothetical protein